MAEWFPLKPQVRLRRHLKTLSPLAYCVLTGLWDWAFDNDGLPDSPAKTAALLDLKPELVRECWAAFRSDCVLQENGRLMPKEIVDANNKVEATTQKRRDSGKAGGHKSGEARRRKAQQPCDDLNNPAFSPDYQTDQTAQTNGHGNIKEVVRQLNEITSPGCGEPEGSLATALESLFPAESPSGFLRLGELVCHPNVKGCPSDVRRWEMWFRARYPRKSKTTWTFKETFAEMLSEPKTLPTAARFLIQTCYNLSANEHARLTKEQFNQALTQGELLAELVGLDDARQWGASGFVPAAFQNFWQKRFSMGGYPSPESVVRYWPDFIKQL